MCWYLLQALEQMKAQSTKRSSIIIALTDGKLDVYPYELTVEQVHLTL